MIAPITEAGMGVWLSNVCPILEKNHHVTLLTSNNPGIEISCSKTIKLDSRMFPNALYCYMPKFKDLFKNNFFNDFDVIHLHGFSTYASDQILKNRKKIKIPIILSVHGNLQKQEKSFLRILHDVFALKNKNNLDYLISVSNAEKNQLIETGFSKEKITVAYNGVNPKIVERKPDGQTILYFGRLAPTKNIDLLIKAFSLCVTKNLSLVIAGRDYGELNSLKILTKKLSLEDRVSFLGEVTENQKQMLFSKASVFVHPSLLDIFALTLLEAASAGIPCIAFDVGGNKEIFSKPKTGILVTKTNETALAQSIDSLLSDLRLYGEISENGKISISEKFTWEKTAETVESVYSKYY
jgi:glycosyltransferase involved in cell wall biosynthesis